MSDQTSLLEDPAIAAAVTTYVKPRRGHRVVGLHDGVMVRDEIVQRRTDLSTLPLGAPLTSEAYVVRSYSKPYETVEVILATPTNRIYAERHKATLDEFLALAGVTTEQKAS